MADAGLKNGRNMDQTDMTHFVLYAVALAMGISGVVTSIITGDTRTVLILYGIAVFALGMAGLDSVASRSRNKKS